ncbi:MAG: hypothetical protein IJA89_06285 [Clostridia bacterium]|nr:hypothetical protein [Clostridia bacterium]
MEIWTKIKKRLKKVKFIKKAVDNYYKKQNDKLIKLTHKYGYDINNKIYALLKGKLDCFALCGTLLGIVRENKFIDYDNDMDYGIVIDSEKDWDVLYKTLTASKFKFSHYFEHEGKINEMAFRYKGVHVDFFGVYVEDNVARFSSFYIAPGVKYLKDQGSTLVVEFDYKAGSFEKNVKDSIFMIPNCYNEILIANYGDNYMTPIKGIETGSSCGNRKFYVDKISSLKRTFVGVNNKE